jgi:hypothetical protein
MEMIDWGNVLAAVAGGALVVCGSWALIMLGLAALRGRSPSTRGNVTPAPRPHEPHRGHTEPPQ